MLVAAVRSYDSWCIALQTELGCVQQQVAASIVTEMWGGTGDWRTLHNEGLHDLYFLSNIVLVIK